MIGAHPDDCEIKAGGTAAKWVDAGFRVTMVSVTNGDAGHYVMSGGELARRRKAECKESAKRGGTRSIVLDNHDGELSPLLSVRKEIVRIIREEKADIVVTHRPNDYHPDHRYTSQLVQDSAYMVTVPNFAPAVPALRRNPVYFYFMDDFEKPVPFQANIAVDVDDMMNVKFDMLDAMESQMYEWLPWHDGYLDDVPEGAKKRRKWLAKRWSAYFESYAERGRESLERRYGKKRASKVRYAEFFEVSEYGARPSEAFLQKLFPFLPKQADVSQ